MFVHISFDFIFFVYTHTCICTVHWCHHGDIIIFLNYLCRSDYDPNVIQLAEDIHRLLIPPAGSVTRYDIRLLFNIVYLCVYVCVHESLIGSFIVFLSLRPLAQARGGGVGGARGGGNSFLGASNRKARTIVLQVTGLVDQVSGR